MTQRLYYDHPYLTEFDATVVDSGDDGRRVYLDCTAFYPESGGQPWDLGTINGIGVTSVIDEGERIAHVVDTPLTLGPVRGVVDEDRRYDHMQQHSGQHLLSAACEELFEWKTLSFHMGAAVSTIELSTFSVTDAQIDALEARVNELGWKALRISTHFVDAAQASGLRKPSERSGELRIVVIDGIDRSACGGTHVRTTAEVLPVQIRRQEKVRGNTRIEFVCGGRALARTRQDYRLLAALARSGNCALEDLSSKLAALQAKAADAAKLAQKVARFEGEELYRNTAAGADGIRRLLIRNVDEHTRARMQTFAAQGLAIAVALGEAVIIECSPDCGVDAAGVLKAAGARGGGSKTSAQGKLAETSELLKQLFPY